MKIWKIEKKEEENEKKKPKEINIQKKNNPIYILVIQSYYNIICSV